MKPCLDCKGSGRYYPLFGPVEDCQRCGGSGKETLRGQTDEVVIFDENPEALKVSRGISSPPSSQSPVFILGKSVKAGDVVDVGFKTDEGVIVTDFQGMVYAVEHGELVLEVPYLRLFRIKILIDKITDIDLLLQAP